MSSTSDNSVTATGAIQDNDETRACGAPSYYAATGWAVFVGNDCATNRWHMHVTGGDNVSSTVPVIAGTNRLAVGTGV